MRDHRDTLTLDLFAPAVSCALAIGELVGALGKLVGVLDRTGAHLAARPRFTDFRVTAFGPLTEDEKDEALRLAEEEGLAAWTVAKRMKRHPSTIAWFLTGLGLRRLSSARKEPFVRKGTMVWPFDKAEDSLILRLALKGETTAAITREVNKRSPHPRSRDTISCRLRMLASDEAAREAA